MAQLEPQIFGGTMILQTASIPTPGSATTFVQTVGLSGVATAIRTGMLGATTPLAVDVLGSLYPIYSPKVPEQRQAVKGLQSALGNYPGVPQDLRTRYELVTLAPVIQLYADRLPNLRRYGQITTSTIPDGADVERPAPSLGDALEFLQGTNIFCLAAGIQYGIFGPAALTAAFRVLANAVFVAQSANSLAGRTHGNLRRRLAPFDMNPTHKPLEFPEAIQPAFLLGHEDILTSALRTFNGGSTIASQVFYVPVDKLNLSPRTIYLIRRSGAWLVGDLCEMSESSLLNARINRASLKKIREALRSLNKIYPEAPQLDLGMDVSAHYDATTSQPWVRTNHAGDIRDFETPIRPTGFLLQPFGGLGISEKAALLLGHLRTYGDLCKRTKQGLFDLGISRRDLRKIESHLATKGLSLGMTII